MVKKAKVTDVKNESTTDLKEPKKNTVDVPLKRTRWLRPPWKKGQSGNPKGKPKKIFTQLIDDIKADGGEVVQPRQIAEAYSLLFSLNEAQLWKIVLDSTKPLVIREVAKKMMTKEWFYIMETMLDRAHGKAKQSIDSNVSGSLTLAGSLLELKKIPQKSEV